MRSNRSASLALAIIAASLVTGPLLTAAARGTASPVGGAFLLLHVLPAVYVSSLIPEALRSRRPAAFWSSHVLAAAVLVALGPLVAPWVGGGADVAFSSHTLVYHYGFAGTLVIVGRMRAGRWLVGSQAGRSASTLHR